MSSAKERLLAASAKRFYSDGVHATGIDAIVTEAGVAKKSLYNNFASKSDLVEAYIDARHQEWLELYRARLACSTTQTERVLATFDAYIDHANDEYEHGFRGCGLLNAAAEFPAGSQERQAVRAHKEEVERLIAAEIKELKGPDTANALAEHFSFLLEGSVARAGLEGNTTKLMRARTIAEHMLDNK